MPSDTCTTTVYVLADRYSPAALRPCGRQIGAGVNFLGAASVHRCVVCGDATCERHAQGHQPGLIACSRCWRAVASLINRLGVERWDAEFQRWPIGLLYLVAMEGRLVHPMRWRLAQAAEWAMAGDHDRQPPELPDRLPDLEADLAAGVVRPLPAPRPLPSWMRCSST